jgi:hypothetical protein
VVLGMACLGLAGMILGNDSSIVTRGPAATDKSLSAGWALVQKPGASPADLEEAESRARSTLRREPLNSVAVSLIGAIRERQGNLADSERMMKAAVAINHRENVASLWLFNHSLSHRDYDQAFLSADMLLRREERFVPQLEPQIINSLEDPAAIEPLGRRLAKRPGWRAPLTELLGASKTNASGLFTLYAAIKKAGGEISPNELSALLNRLLSEQRYEEAYLDWIILLPDSATSKLTYVYDGDFSGLPEFRPFGWNFTNGSSSYVESPPGRGDPALHVVYDGVANRQFPAQLLVLPVGRYTFTGDVMSATPATEGRMEWTISCVRQTGNEELARAPAPNTAGEWRRFSMALSVPPGCPAQMLALGRTPSEKEADIDLWYDHLKVLPAGASQ